jgi:hypothetical protein
MFFSRKNIFLIVKKLQLKNLHVHLDNLRTFSFAKKLIFLFFNERGQIMSHKKEYFYYQILPFWIAQTTSRFFMEGLYAHVECEDMHTNFLFRIFNI